MSAARAKAPAKGDRRAGAIPAWAWLKSYRPAWLRADLVAGITLAAYLLPAALGDASLAGLPPQAGLYACLAGGALFWLFCSSRHTAPSVTSAISLLIGSSLGELSGGDPSRHAALAACAALLVAAMAFAAWLAKAGAAVHFISETVMIGFKAGVALHLASTQLPKLFGVKGGHGDFWERMGEFSRHLGEVHPASMAVGCAALAALIAGKRWMPDKPVALFVVVAGIAASGWFDLGERGVVLLGEVPGGLAPLTLPDVMLSDLRELMPLALACFLLGAVETAAIGRMGAEKHGYRVDANQELLALAGANLAAGFFRGFPVSGGMSQSLVNESAGARTPLSGLIASGVVLAVAVFFTGMLAGLPQPVLAAVVLMAVSGLVKPSVLARLWRFHRGEFLVAVAALAGVLWAGLLDGALLGAAISLALLIRRASAPRVAFLGRIPGTRRYTDIARHPDNEPTPGVLAFRVESSIVYFNAEHVADTIMGRLDASGEPVGALVCDLSSSPYIDIAGARMLAGLAAEARKRGLAFRLVEAHASVREMLRVEGLEPLVGTIDRFGSLADAVEASRMEGRGV